MATIRDDDFGQQPDGWNDLLLGTAEDDTLYAGKGSDTLVGGAGHDTFVWSQPFAQVVIQRDADGSLRIGGHTLREIESIRFADVTLSVEDALPRADRQHAHTRGDDVLVGDDHGYGLVGDDGNDVFTGHGGDDTLYGGKGEDTAVYRGERSDYRILFDYASRRYVIEDQAAGRDGSDQLQDIEWLQFADGEFQLPMPADYYSALTPEQLARIDGTIGEPPRPWVPSEDDFRTWIGLLPVETGPDLVLMDTIGFVVAAGTAVIELAGQPAAPAFDAWLP